MAMLATEGRRWIGHRPVSPYSGEGAIDTDRTEVEMEVLTADVGQISRSGWRMAGDLNHAAGHAGAVVTDTGGKAPRAP